MNVDSDGRMIDNFSHIGEELEVHAELSATIEWKTSVHTLDSIRGVRHRGIYIVEREGKPVYVGIAWSGSIGSRWRCRVSTFRQLRLPAGVRNAYRIRVGTIKGTNFSRGLSVKDLYETVERVLIRYLMRVRKYGLGNFSSTRQFTVGSSGIKLTNNGARPIYLAQVIRRAAGQVQEVSAPLRCCPDCGRAGTAFLLI